MGTYLLRVPSDRVWEVLAQGRHGQVLEACLSPPRGALCGPGGRLVLFLSGIGG